MSYFGARRLQPDLMSARAVEVALALAARGARVMPVGADKRPILADWPNVASADPAQIVAWEMRGARGWNFAVVTGRVSGVFVLDIDGARGAASLSDLEARLGPLPDTVRVRSGREGVGAHYWFALPPDQLEPRTCGSQLAPGIDVRGRGGQIVIPGSRHKSGRRYTWVAGHAPDEVELAVAPPDWVAVIPVAGAPVGRGGRRSGPPAEGSGPIIFGDGEGGQGFDRPIYRTACGYFCADPDSDVDELLDFLVRAVSSAPVDPARGSIARYLDQVYLRTQCDKALDFAISVRNADEDLAEDLRAALADNGSKSRNG